jgi:two-component sensor histidine kinase
MNANEQLQQLKLMHQKALQFEDRIGVIISEAYLLKVQHELKLISTIQLYKRILPYIEEMRKIGFGQFIHYDLNVIISYSVADLPGYWGSQPANSLKYLKIAEQYVSSSAISKKYHIVTKYGLFNVYYQQHDLPNFYNYGWQLYQVSYQINGELKSQPYVAGYWQAYALSLMAIIRNEHKDSVAYKLVKDALRIYKSVKIESDSLKHIQEEVRVLDMLTVALIAMNYLKEAKPLITRLGVVVKKLEEAGEENEEAEWGWCRDLELYYEKIGDYKKALLAKRKADMYYSRLYQRNSKHELDRTREEYKVKAYADELKKAKARQQQQQIITLSVVGLMMLFSAVAYAVYRRINYDKKLISTQKAILEETLIEKETLIKEVHHRVKNNLQIILGLLEKQSMKTSDETTRKLLQEGQNRVFSMALVHQSLYQSDNLSAIDIQQYFTSLAQNIQTSQQFPQHQIAIEIDVDDVKMNVDTAIPLGLILNELLTNCYKYAFVGRKSGLIAVSFKPIESGYCFTVKDDGVGISHDIDWSKSQSLGLTLVHGLVRQLSGSFEVISMPNQGTQMVVNIPRNQIS